MQVGLRAPIRVPGAWPEQQRACFCLGRPVQADLPQVLPGLMLGWVRQCLPVLARLPVSPNIGGRGQAGHDGGQSQDNDRY